MKLKKILKEIRAGRMAIKNDHPGSIGMLVMYFSNHEVRGSEDYYWFIEREGGLVYECCRSGVTDRHDRPVRLINASELWQRINKKSEKKSKVEKLKKRVDKLEEFLGEVAKRLKKHLRDEAHKDNTKEAKYYFDLLRQHIEETVKEQGGIKRVKFPSGGVFSAFVDGEWVVPKYHIKDGVVSIKEMAKAIDELSESLKKIKTQQGSTGDNEVNLPEGWKMEDLVRMFDSDNRPTIICERTFVEFKERGAYLDSAFEFSIVKDSVGENILIARNKKK